MRYWYDTEFVDRGPDYSIALVSIGIVAEDGREYYAQAREGLGAAIFHDWVRENVVPHLTHMKLTTEPPRRKGDSPTLHLETCGHDNLALHPDCPWKIRDDLAKEVKAFCDPEQYGKPELWGYYADYDHVVLAQIFGTMVQLPEGFPMWTRDIKQLAWMLGDPKLPEQTSTEHHALADARWNREAWEFLQSIQDEHEILYGRPGVAPPKGVMFP